MSTMTASRETRAKPSFVINDEGPRDLVAFRPGCKTMETISLVGRAMAPTRRFTQRKHAVYHACGSDVPCRLYSLG
jgi:hypothetical protein